MKRINRLLIAVLLSLGLIASLILIGCHEERNVGASDLKPCNDTGGNPIDLCIINPVKLKVPIDDAVEALSQFDENTYFVRIQKTNTSTAKSYGKLPPCCKTEEVIMSPTPTADKGAQVTQRALFAKIEDLRKVVDVLDTKFFLSAAETESKPTPTPVPVGAP